MKKTIILFGAATLGLLLTGSAQAHVDLIREAHVGSPFLLGLEISHGCGGSPTIAVRLQIPDGITSVQPVAKPGWDIEIVLGDAGVAEIHWTGGNLPDAFYDQFFFRAQFAETIEPGAIAWFPMVQECTVGVHRWITVPVQGEPEPDEPAVGLRAAEAHEEHGH